MDFGSIRNIFDRRKFAPNFQMPSIQAPRPLAQEQYFPEPMQNKGFVPTPMQKLGTPALDDYNNYLKGMPGDENPSIWTKILAAIGGASDSYFRGPAAGIETASSLRDMGRERKLRNWGLGLEPRRAAAQIESQNLGRENAAERNDVTRDYNTGRLEIARINANTARMRLTQSNYDYLGQNEKGNPIIIDKTTGNHQVLEDVDMFSKPEELDKTLAAAMERVKAQQTGANSRTAATNATSRANTKDNIASREKISQGAIDAAYERQKRALEAGSSVSGKRVASLENIDNQAKLMRLSIKYPDLIKQTSSGKYITVTPSEPGLWSDDLRPQFEQLMTEMDEQPVRPKLPNVVSPVSSPKPKQGGFVNMVDAKGNSYSIPSNEVEAAKKDGLRIR